AASARASNRAESAEPAAVRAAVMTSPSMTACGTPVSGSKAAIRATWLGSPRAGFWGNWPTSLAARAPAPGTYAGIASSAPPTGSTIAAFRCGTEATPLESSAMADATASTSASRSRTASTSRRDRISTGRFSTPAGRRVKPAPGEAVHPEGVRRAALGPTMTLPAPPRPHEPDHRPHHPLHRLAGGRHRRCVAVARDRVPQPPAARPSAALAVELLRVRACAGELEPGGRDRPVHGDDPREEAPRRLRV